MVLADNQTDNSTLFETIVLVCPGFPTDQHWFLQNVENLVFYNGSRNRPLAFSDVEWCISVLKSLEEFYYTSLSWEYSTPVKVRSQFHFSCVIPYEQIT